MPTAPQELETLLNEVVKKADQIDAIFVYDLRNSFVLFHSTLVKDHQLFETLFGDKATAMASFGNLRNVGDAVNKFAKEAGQGDLNYAVFQLREGLLLMYFDTLGRIPIAIGFVSAGQVGLGNLLFFSERYIDDIKELLRKL
jgi:hypothetical protein